MPTAASLNLLPNPRSLELLTGFYKLESHNRIALTGVPAPDLLFSAQRLQDHLRRDAGVEWTLAATATGPRGEIGARLAVDTARVNNAEGYEIVVNPEGIEVIAGSPRGVFYAVCTLGQLLAQSSNSRMPCLRIVDAPDFPNRGVMLDVSRDKVPSMATLYALVEMLASWKINQVQLYTEHTFAYRNHAEVWRHASPLTEQEVLELDAFCRARFVELVPNQNSFGHMRRWLTHARYRDLAECPEGCDTIWGHFDEPFTLNPGDPRSLALVEELYDELLPNFASRQFNVGCDETVDLGQGRSKVECETRGAGRVYLDFVLKVYAAVKARGHTMMFWGDIVVQHPELIPELPRDAIALEWGYEADHPFQEHAAAFAAAGIPFYVCPGTSTWNSITGRMENARENLLRAAESGLKHGAVGYLNTDWGDNGHWQYLPFSYPGFAYGAGLGWCVEANRALDIAHAVSAYALGDPTGSLGKVIVDLARVDDELGIRLHNSTALFRILQLPLAGIREELYGLTPAALERAQAATDRALRPLRRVRSTRPETRLVVAEIKSAAALLQHAIVRGRLAWEKDPAKSRALERKLKRDLPHLIQEYRRLWHARNRPGGFKDSVARLKKMQDDYKL